MDNMKDVQNSTMAELRASYESGAGAIREFMERGETLSTSFVDRFLEITDEILRRSSKEGQNEERNPIGDYYYSTEERNPIGDYYYSPRGASHRFEAMTNPLHPGSFAGVAALFPQNGSVYKADDNNDKCYVQQLRSEYPPKTKVRMIEMPGDPMPIEPGTIGEVEGVDGAGHIMVKWENGRWLNLIPAVDRFEKVGNHD